MNCKIVIIENELIPTEVTIFKNVYSIKKIDKCYHIKNYKLGIDEEDNIVNIYIDSIHPNVNPETKLYCCPVPIESMKLWYKDYRSIEFIENQLLKKFCLDLSYFSYKHVKYAMRYLIETNFDSRIFIKIDRKYMYPKLSNMYPDPGSKKFKELTK